MKSEFKLTKEQKDEMVAMILTYFEKEKDEKIGNLAGMLLLDFFIEKLAPYFYNLGVEDSHAYLATKIDDIFEIQK